MNRAWPILVGGALGALACQKQSRHGGGDAAAGQPAAGPEEAMRVASDPGHALIDGVTRLDATHFIIDDRALDQLRLRLDPTAEAIVAGPSTSFALPHDGVEPGDTLAAVNHQPTSDATALGQLSTSPGATFSITVHRQGEPVTLEYRMRVPFEVADVKAGVGRRDDFHYEITRPFLARLLADPGLLHRAARAVPSMRDRKRDGFKLYAVHPSMVFGRLGIQNGDTLRTVNGESFADGDAALRALPAVLRARRTLTLGLNRRGRDTNLDWDMVDTLSPEAIAGQNVVSQPPAPASAFAATLGLPSPPLLSPGLASQMTAPDVADQIKAVDSTHVEIKRALFAQMTAQPDQFARDARVIPSVKDGKPNGFKLYAIRPQCLFARLGFMNGDTVTAVNGRELGGPGNALDVFTHLKTAKTFTLDITRRGQPVELEWRIR